ncbi:MAG: chorismate--pyruvate lyase [Wujia sp.]
MFETMFYNVVRLDGDYAFLKQIDESGKTIPDTEEKCVARALLPADIDEGSRLAYEMLEYTKI